MDSLLPVSLSDQGFRVGVGVPECCSAADVSVMQSAFPVNQTETGLQRPSRAEGGAASDTRRQFRAPEVGNKHPPVSKAGGVFDDQSHVPLSHNRARWISDNYTVVNPCLMDDEQRLSSPS